MAVIKAKQEKIVPFFLGLMARETVAAQVVTRLPQNFFNGAQNDTVTMRINGLRATARDYEWRTRTDPIQLDDIEGGEGVDVKLDTHSYSATALTDEQMTLDDIAFATEVLNPQALAVADRYEAKTVAALRAAPFADTVTVDSTVDPHLVAIEARRLLDSHKVAPTSGRAFLVGSDVEASWLSSDRLSKYDSTGQTGTPALRDATIGRLAGSPVVVSTALEPNEAYYLHKSAFVLGNVAPVVPSGVTAGRTGISRNGFAVRWIQDYDPMYLRDRSVVSSFLGVTSVQDERKPDGSLLDPNPGGGTEGPYRGERNVRAVKIEISGTGSVIPVPETPAA